MRRLSLLSQIIRFKYLSSGRWAGEKTRSIRSGSSGAVEAVGGPAETAPPTRHVTGDG